MKLRLFFLAIVVAITCLHLYSKAAQCLVEVVSQRPAIVMFTWEYCGPCKTAKAILQSEISELRRQGIHVVIYDVWDHKEKADRLGITATPTFLVVDQAGTIVLRTYDVSEAIQKARMLK